MHQIIYHCRRITFSTLIVLLLFTHTLTIGDPAIPVDLAEQQLVNVISLAEKNEWNSAYEESEDLVTKYPQFRAGTVLHEFIEKKQLPTAYKPTVLLEKDADKSGFLESIMKTGEVVYPR